MLAWGFDQPFIRCTTVWTRVVLQQRASFPLTGPSLSVARLVPHAATFLKVRDAGAIPAGFRQITCAEAQAYQVTTLFTQCLQWMIVAVAAGALVAAYLSMNSA